MSVSMIEHVVHDFQHFGTTGWLFAAILLIAGIVYFFYFQGRGLLRNFPRTEFAFESAGDVSDRPSGSGIFIEQTSDPDLDTVFIIPDISHYTKFITGDHFSNSRKQQIIFSLINAIIEAATKTVELSKLEGDAALFFANARSHSPEEIGDTVMGIFEAFFKERDRLIAANFCSCRVCRHIGDLDLKIFVHRGPATRFKFRGSVDHFGSDIVILHSLMKNSVTSDRYVMVTDAADDCIRMPDAFETHDVEEKLDHIGNVRATVFTIDEYMVDRMLPPSLECSTE